MPRGRADGHLTVGSEVSEGGERRLPDQAAGDQPSENVAPDKATDVGQESDRAGDVGNPPEIGGAEHEFLEVRRAKWRLREGIDGKPAEEVVHRRVAADQCLAHRPIGGETGGHGAERFAYEVAEDPVVSTIESDAAHQIRTVTRLRIESGLGGNDFSGGEIHELSGKGCGTEIDRDAEAFTRLGAQGLLASENGRGPLLHFNGHWTLSACEATQAPTLSEFVVSEGFAHFVRDRDFTRDDANAARAAEQRTATGELDAEFEQAVAKRSAWGGIDMDVVAHLLSINWWAENSARWSARAALESRPTRAFSCAPPRSAP